MAFVAIQNLIDKQDRSEIIRDQIGYILVNEVDNQKTLATAANKDSRLWDLKIYLERHNPIQDWLNTDIEVTDPLDLTPRVNVQFAKSVVDPSKSNSVSGQQYLGTYNIDVYAVGVAQDDGAGGHIPGDKQSSLELQRAVRLVRNILMASNNTDLQLQGVVWDRMASAITIQPLAPEQLGVWQITGARLSFEVGYLEDSPQWGGVPLETINVKTFYAEDGSLLVDIELDLTN